MGVGGCCCKQNLTKSINLDNIPDINNQNGIKNENNPKIINQNPISTSIKTSSYAIPYPLQPNVLKNENQEKYNEDESQYEDIHKQLGSSHQDTGSEFNN